MFQIIETQAILVKVKTSDDTVLTFGEGQIYRREFFNKNSEIVKIKKLELQNDKDNFSVLVDVMNNGKITFRNVRMDLKILHKDYIMVKSEVEPTYSDNFRLDDIE